MLGRVGRARFQHAESFPNPPLILAAPMPYDAFLG